jgi:putative restriction endonuclease
MMDIAPLIKTRLDKAAVDSGFDVAEGVDGGWLRYRSTSSPLRVALSCPGARPAAALSMVNVLAELRWPGATPTAAPPGFAAGLGFVDFHDLQTALTRAFALSRALPDELLHTWQKTLKKLGSTEREATVKQRIGQDLFREGLLALWDGRCGITGLAVPELLRASHAKPWKHATDEERLDVYNGLLLAAHLDAAFDAGLIAVEDSGQVIASPALDMTAGAVLGMNSTSRVERLTDRHLPYLAWHRQHMFRR